MLMNGKDDEVHHCEKATYRLPSLRTPATKSIVVVVVACRFDDVGGEWNSGVEGMMR